VGADEREQLLLALLALAADLREAGGDHDQRAHSLAQRLLGCIDDERRRKADDGEVDLVRDLVDGPIAADAGDGLALPVHRVRRALEVGAEDVAVELPADRPAPPRSADHGHGSRLEERAERSGHGDVVALVDTRLEALGRGDGEPHLDLAARELAGQLEPDRLEHAEHVAVVGEHLREEGLDSDRRRPARELLEEPGPDPTALELVGDAERGLGDGRVAEALVARDRDDLLAVTLREGPEQRASLRPVRVEQPLDELWPDRRNPVESLVQALRRETAEELEQLVGVVGAGRPEPEREAVLEDDVDGVGRSGGVALRRHPECSYQTPTSAFTMSRVESTPRGRSSTGSTTRR
jgi:hypothetical protein